MKPSGAATGDGILDLGRVAGGIFCFGGPYSNVQATRAALAEAERLGFPPERVVCTGDVVAYCADPAATVALVRAAGIRVVMGNCEESLAFDGEDCGCGFADDSQCAAWSRAWFAFAQAALDADAKAWMAGLPRQIRLGLGGRRLAVIHGGDQNISEYVFQSTPAAAKAECFERLAALDPIDGVIGGHAGLPFTQIVGGRLWHNPGVVGMPANDGTPNVWFSILTAGADGISVALNPLTYDHAAAARALRAVSPNLPYALTLENGLWPNMDVLPAAERARVGRPLQAETVVWPARAPVAAE
ncbi:MAG TPA: metallophosphoesterase family protein [Rhodospirillales bacterium]